MVSITISLDLETLRRIEDYSEQTDIKLSAGASKLIRLGYARWLELNIPDSSSNKNKKTTT